MNKEQVYVPLLTPEDCKRAYEILTKAGEPIYKDTEIRLMYGEVNEEYPCIHFSQYKEPSWSGYFESTKGIIKTQITLDQLSEMLMGKGEIIHPDSEKGVFVTQLLEIMDGDYYNFQEQSEAIIRKVQEYTDQQTLELRKELEEKEKQIALIIRKTECCKEDLIIADIRKILTT